MKENSLPFAKSVYIAENLCLPEQHFVHYVNYIMSLIFKINNKEQSFLTVKELRFFTSLLPFMCTSKHFVVTD